MFRELLGGTKPKTTESPASAQHRPSKGVPVPSAVDTIVGTGAQFEGNLKTEGNVRIHGTFTGDITAYGRVVVGEQGKVDGDLIGESVDVAGQVCGNITTRKVAVLHTGKVKGDLRLEKLQTEEGAFVEGLVTMEEKVALPGKPEPREAVGKEEATAEVSVEAIPAGSPKVSEPVEAEEPAAKEEAKGKKNRPKS